MSSFGRSRDQSTSFARTVTGGRLMGELHASKVKVQLDEKQHSMNSVSRCYGDYNCDPPKYAAVIAFSCLTDQSPRFSVVQCPSTELALSNRLILHSHCGFEDGEHVLVKEQFPLTVKLVYFIIAPILP